ncbi:cytochrome c maturation protein CcmE [Roseovarius gahaiensis]|uniref:Cytochrome c-type biogenesis protein CcmE n=1 Tax=Roseovarius gahaiensis TaxID=2716691 RepID=A0A967B811_9RHOB|nr:cytochrome c maturation protein CcmE [Roseovarius gahaiensis]NHQ72990.1 cytochrome c maturation protein CcmE [Roseovarius gahaiensis]
MKSLKKRRRVHVVLIAVVALLVSVSLIGWAFKDGINFFRSPSEVIAKPPGATEVFRIGGLVEGGSLVRGQGEEIRFNVTDGGAAVPVTYKGVLPDLFEENQGMVGMGTYDGKVFRATEILAKHDEDYMPKEVVDALKEQGVYQEPEAQYNGHNSGS